MSPVPAQTYANHNRVHPWYHLVVAPLLLACFAFSIYLLLHEPSVVHAWLAVFTLAVLMLAMICRVYALKVQDRIIRLEERLRLSALLAEPMRARIHELRESQLIALRFAADDEIPELVARTLRENLDSKQIKKAINNWRPDYWRV